MTLGFRFVPIDTRLPEHPRFKKIPKALRRAALGLYVAGYCYSQEHSPGLVPSALAEDDDPIIVAELVRVGLWIPRDDGDWSIFNWEKKSAGAFTSSAERMRRLREKRKSDVTGDADVTSPTVTGDANTVTECSPSPSISSSESSQRGEPERGPPGWFAETAQRVMDDTGERFAVPEAWIRYAGHRTTVGKPRNAPDASYWLGTVMVPEARKERMAASDRRLNQQRRDGPPERPKQTREEARREAQEFAAQLAARNKGAA